MSFDFTVRLSRKRLIYWYVFGFYVVLCMCMWVKWSWRHHFCIGFHSNANCQYISVCVREIYVCVHVCVWIIFSIALTTINKLGIRFNPTVNRKTSKSKTFLFDHDFGKMCSIVIRFNSHNFNVWILCRWCLWPGILIFGVYVK